MIFADHLLFFSSYVKHIHLLHGTLGICITYCAGYFPFDILQCILDIFIFINSYARHVASSLCQGLALACDCDTLDFHLTFFISIFL